MKQTAVENLIEYFIKEKNNGCYQVCIHDLIAQLYVAKEIEKEQIMNAFEAAEKDCGRDFLHGDLYYNETFKPE
jgi:hypothetical protein